MNSFNFSTRRVRVNNRLLTHAEQILSGWLEGEVQGDEFVAINPLRPDNNTGSFNINLKSGIWKDFAIDDFSGPDLVSLYMALNNVDETAALDAIEGELEKLGLNRKTDINRARPKRDKAGQPTSPAPDDVHLPPDMHPDLGTPSMIWEYQTEDRQTAFYVYRFETAKGKETRPVSFNPQKQGWQWGQPQPPLPLYNLPDISDRKDSGVVVVEGEKAADAASHLFPGYVCTTSAGGSSSALKSDWSALYEREVILAPDADETGIKYIQLIAAELLVNQSDVFLIDTLALGWQDGEDVADYPELDEAWLHENKIPVRDWGKFKDMDNLIVEAAARLTPLDYDRNKDYLVELLGDVNKRTLDSLVKQSRKSLVEADEDDAGSNGLFEAEDAWHEPVDGKALLLEIQGVVQSHVILSQQESLAVALWVLQTYVFTAFRVCPRLLVSSPEKRCGKTTLLETVQAMCFRGLAAANISAASLYRGLEAWSPTLLIDEADTFLQGNDELRGILNSGHTRSTAYVVRTVGDNHEPYLFTTFAPIAIGMIKRPPDTLLDRSVVIRLQRKLGTDPVIPLPLEAENEYQAIRQKCLRWKDDNILELEGDRSITPDDIANDRARDNWTPLMAIARQCDMLVEAQSACRALTLKDEDSLTVELLADIKLIFSEVGKDKLPSKILVKKLIALEERPWAEYHRGKPLTQNQLARLLKDFDIHTIQARSGSKNLKHYQLAELKPLFERYLKNNSDTPGTKTAATTLQVDKTQDKTKSSDVSVDVAEAVSDNAPSTENPVVADNKTLPKQDDGAKSLKNNDLPQGSGVALKPGKKSFNVSKATCQETSS